MLVSFLYLLIAVLFKNSVDAADESVGLWTKSMSTRKGSRIGKKSWLKTLELVGTTQDKSLKTFMRFIPNDLKYTGTFTFLATFPL